MYFTSLQELKFESCKGTQKKKLFNYFSIYFFLSRFQINIYSTSNSIYFNSNQLNYPPSKCVFKYNAPIVSYLLFADDCFLFFRAEPSEAMVMKNILEVYESASGQAINYQKSEIFFSRNVSQSKQLNITNILQVQAVLGTGKYLGLPFLIGRSKKATFNFIKDRIWKKINSWSSKCLSKAGREVLIKMLKFILVGSLWCTRQRFALVVLGQVSYS